MAVLAGWDADVLLSASPSISIGGSPVAFTDAGDHINYTSSDAGKKWWDKLQVIQVRQSANGSTGWSTVPATDYVWQPCGAKLTFSPARVPGTNAYIQINAGYYYNVSSVGDANEWTLTQTQDVVDTTPFQQQWRMKTPTIKDASAKFHTFKPDNTFSKELGNLMVCVLYLDKSAGTRYEMYGWLDSDAVKTASTGVIEQDVNINGEGTVFFYLS